MCLMDPFQNASPLSYCFVVLCNASTLAPMQFERFLIQCTGCQVTNVFPFSTFQKVHWLNESKGWAFLTINMEIAVNKRHTNICQSIDWDMGRLCVSKIFILFCGHNCRPMYWHDRSRKFGFIVDMMVKGRKRLNMCGILSACTLHNTIIIHSLHIDDQPIAYVLMMAWCGQIRRQIF